MERSTGKSVDSSVAWRRVVVAKGRAREGRWGHLGSEDCRLREGASRRAFGVKKQRLLAWERRNRIKVDEGAVLLHGRSCRISRAGGDSDEAQIAENLVGRKVLGGSHAGMM